MAGVRRIALLLSVAVVALAVALPNTGLAWLRSEVRWLGLSVNWIESLWPAVDLMHVALFGLLGITARVALPSVRLATLISALVAVAGVSEVLQFWVPGRTPRASDFGLDVVGAVVGVGVTASLLWISSRVRRRN